MNSTNGLLEKNRRNVDLERVRSDRKIKHQASPQGYSLADTTRAGLSISMRSPTAVIALGSTASRVLFRLINHISSEFDFLPETIACLALDADASVPDQYRSHFMSFGHDGAGTLGSNGRAMFLQERSKIAATLQRHLLPLLAGDLRTPTQLTARELTSVHVVAGPGGTSGGALHPMIDVIHDVMQKLSIGKVHVHLHLIDPSIPICDIHRNLTAEKQEIVPSNFAANVQQVLADFAIDETLQLKRVDGTTYLVRSQERVTSLSLYGRSNGRVDLQTSEEAETMLAWTLFQRCFRDCGMAHESLACDERGYAALYGFNC